MSPALAGGVFTTEPPGQPLFSWSTPSHLGSHLSLGLSQEPSFLVSLSSCSPTTTCSSRTARVTPRTFPDQKSCVAPWCLRKTKSDSSSWHSRPLMDGPDILSSLIPMWPCHAVPRLVPRTCPLRPTSGLSICSLYSLPFSVCLNHSGPSRIGWSTVSPWSHRSLLGPALSIHPRCSSALFFLGSWLHML